MVGFRLWAYDVTPQEGTSDDRITDSSPIRDDNSNLLEPKERTPEKHENEMRKALQLVE